MNFTPKKSASSAIYKYVFYAFIDTMVFAKNSCKSGVANTTSSLYRYTVACVRHGRSLELGIKLAVYSICELATANNLVETGKKPIGVEKKWTRNVRERLPNSGEDYQLARRRINEVKVLNPSIEFWQFKELSQHEK